MSTLSSLATTRNSDPCSSARVHFRESRTDDGGWNVDTSFMKGRCLPNPELDFMSTDITRFVRENSLKFFGLAESSTTDFITACGTSVSPTSLVLSSLSQPRPQSPPTPSLHPSPNPVSQTPPTPMHSSTNSFSARPGNPDTSRPPQSTPLANRPNERPAS